MNHLIAETKFEIINIQIGFENTPLHLFWQHTASWLLMAIGDRIYGLRPENTYTTLEICSTVSELGHTLGHSSG